MEISKSKSLKIQPCGFSYSPMSRTIKNLVFNFYQRRKIYSKINFHDWGPYHIETSPLISTANKWTRFYMIRTSVIKKFYGSPLLSIVKYIYRELNFHKITSM